MIAENFEEIDFDEYPGLERVAGILVGDEATIDDCRPLVGQWYRLLIAKCFLLCPTTGNFPQIFHFFNQNFRSENYYKLGEYAHPKRQRRPGSDGSNRSSF